MIIDELSGFNEVIEYYRLMLKLVQDFSPEQYFTSSESQSIIKDLEGDKWLIPSIRACCLEESLHVLQTVELGEISKEKIQRFRRFFGDDTVFEQIKTTKEISFEEKVRYLRNCLAHANYSVEVTKGETEDKPDINICLNEHSQVLRGKIPYNKFYNLANAYRHIYSGKGVQPELFKLNSQYISCRNKYILDRLLDSIVKNDGKPLSPECKIFMKQYIEFLGFASIEKLQHNNVQGLMAITELFTNLIYNFENNSLVQTIDMGSLGKTFMEAMRHQHEKDSDEEAFFGLTKKLVMQTTLNSLSYQTPFIYSNMLLGLCNYIFNYIKEVNKNGEKKGTRIFDYYDIDMTGIAIKDSDPDSCLIKKVFPKDKIEQQVRLLEAKQKKAQHDIKMANKKKRKLEDPKNLDPKKEEKRLKIEKEIEEAQARLNTEMERLNKLQLESQDMKPYVDSTNFFRFLRNSIAHGNYKIDYITALRRKDFSKIRFHFEDYDKDKGKKVFELDITAKRLLELVMELQSKVNHAIQCSNQGSRIKNMILKEALYGIEVDDKNLGNETRVEGLSINSNQRGEENIGENK